LRNLAAIACAAAVLGGCGGGDDNGYPEESVDAFIAECRSQANATPKDCRCVIERLQQTMPYDQFAEADEALTEGREAEAAALRKLEAAVRRCGAA
jgi:hypothetical protein